MYVIERVLIIIRSATTRGEAHGQPKYVVLRGTVITDNNFEVSPESRASCVVKAITRARIGIGWVIRKFVAHGWPLASGETEFKGGKSPVLCVWPEIMMIVLCASFWQREPEEVSGSQVWESYGLLL
jgi:hypothetical protein